MDDVKVVRIDVTRNEAGLENATVHYWQGDHRKAFETGFLSHAACADSVLNHLLSLGMPYDLKKAKP